MALAVVLETLAGRAEGQHGQPEQAPGGWFRSGSQEATDFAAGGKRGVDVEVSLASGQASGEGSLGTGRRAAVAGDERGVPTCIQGEVIEIAIAATGDAKREATEGWRFGSDSGGAGEGGSGAAVDMGCGGVAGQSGEGDVDGQYVSDAVVFDARRTGSGGGVGRSLNGAIEGRGVDDVRGLTGSREKKKSTKSVANSIHEERYLRIEL